MRLIPPAVIVRQEQDQLVREKEIPKQDRTPHRIIEDDLHEMLEVPYFEEHYLNAPIPNYDAPIRIRDRQQPYNLGKTIRRLGRYQC